jgi:hypothetical protein
MKLTILRHVAVLGASFVLASCSALLGGYQGPPVCNQPYGCACTDGGCSCSGTDAGEFSFFFQCQMQCQDNCSLACADVLECQATCGNSCNLSCINADPREVACGDNCVLTLVDAGGFDWGTCGANCQGHVYASTIVVGPNSQVDCAGGGADPFSGGTVYCNGPCTVTCSGTCPGGPCAVSCSKGQDPDASHPNGCP